MDYACLDNGLIICMRCVMAIHTAGVFNFSLEYVHRCTDMHTSASVLNLHTPYSSS